MYRHLYKNRGLWTTATVAVLGSLVGVVACSDAPSQFPSSDKTAGNAGENVGSTSADLLTTACTYDASNNLTLKVLNNEVAYVGMAPSCSTEPCVVTNATDSQGNVCKVNSTAKSITIAGTGTTGNTEKVILDYTNGLFAMAGTSTLVNVTLDTSQSAADAGGATHLSKLVVMAPSSGSNIALGVNGFDMNTCASAAGNCAAARSGGAKLDVAITWTTKTLPGSVIWQGAPTGTPTNVFTADATGWTTMPAGWDTGAHLSTVVGVVYAGALTAQGGPGADTIAGGAGSNTLNGGAGNDTFLQSATARAESIVGGDGVDTIDYSFRSAPLSIYVGNGSKTSGATGEGDIIAHDVEMVLGGSGNDTIDASAVTGTDVVLMGQGGNDVLIGGGGVDDLCGGTGNDRLVWSNSLGNNGHTETGDYLVGGGGIDTVDYSGASSGVMVCLNPADPTCAAIAVGDAGATTMQFGIAGEADFINDVSVLHVCPRSTLTVGVAAGGTASASPTSAGGAMAVDVENVTGHPSQSNTLDCDKTGGGLAGSQPCTLVGGSAADTLLGSTNADALFGAGGADSVSTNGGADTVDVSHGGSAKTETIDCHANGDTPTILYTSGDTLALSNCAGAAQVAE